MDNRSLNRPTQAIVTAKRAGRRKASARQNDPADRIRAAADVPLMLEIA
jgi:hypothetical protein